MSSCLLLFGAAMSLEQKYGLGRFDGKDYEYWRFRLMTLIRAEELEYVLEVEYSDSEDESDEDENDVNDFKDAKSSKDVKDIKDVKDVKKTTAQQKRWERDDRKCLAIIIRHLADSHIVYARDAKTSVELIRKLDEMYKQRGAASRIFLKREWQNLKMKSNDSLTVHFRRFDEMVTSIRACGCKLDNTDVIDQLLMSLPENYAVTVEIIEAMRSPSMEAVRMKLLNREGKLKQQRHDEKTRVEQVAMLADEKDVKVRSESESSCNRKSKEFFCYTCGGRGHIAKYCKKSKNGDSSECNFVKSDFARSVEF